MRYNLRVMRRTDSEIKILTIRQRYSDAMRKLMARDVIDMEAYRYLCVRLEVCKVLLSECRLNAYSGQRRLFR